MSYVQIMSLIINIATSMGLPPMFCLSIALTENPTLNPNAIHVNENGTFDYGIFQLNSSWYKDENWNDPEVNIRAGCEHIKLLSQNPLINTWYGLAICYNAGTLWIKNGSEPPIKSVEYAIMVYELYNKHTNSMVETIIRKR